MVPTTMLGARNYLGKVGVLHVRSGEARTRQHRVLEYRALGQLIEERRTSENTANGIILRWVRVRPAPAAVIPPKEAPRLSATRTRGIGEGKISA